MNSFSDIIAGARRLGVRRFVVTQAADPVVLEAVEAGAALEGHRIVHVPERADAAVAAVRLGP